MFINIGKNKLQEIDDFMGQKLIYGSFLSLLQISFKLFCGSMVQVYFEQVFWWSYDVYYIITIICKLYWYTEYEIDTWYLCTGKRGQNLIRRQCRFSCIICTLLLLVDTYQGFFFKQHSNKHFNYGMNILFDDINFSFC